MYIGIPAIVISLGRNHFDFVNTNKTMKDRLCCGSSETSGGSSSGLWSRSRKKGISPSVSAPLHLILQSPTPASHEWRKVGGLKHVCQLCHLKVEGEALRCRDCGFLTHSQCATNHFFPITKTPIIRFPPSSDKGHPGSGPASVPSSPTTNKTTSFEPRIKKLLAVSIPTIPVTPTRSSSLPKPEQESQQVSESEGESYAHPFLLVHGNSLRSDSKTPEARRDTPGSGGDLSSDRIPFILDGISSADDVEERPHHHYQPSTGGTDGERGRIIVIPELITPTSTTPTPGCSSTALALEESLRYENGPLNGALYALVKPKGPSSADSGISVTVDQMKDLDRLLNALVEDAESIPDIPYHPRQDSQPFSYGISDPAVLASGRPSRQPQRAGTTRVSTTVTQPSAPLYYHHPISPAPVQQQQRSLLQSSPPTSRAWTQNHQVRSQPFQSHRPSTEGLRLNLWPSSTDVHVRNWPRDEETRVRSHSADGRRNEDSDAWLARQMQRLQEKKSSKFKTRNDWLEELKRTLPRDEVILRPSSILRVHSPTPPSVVSTTTTPNPLYSESEDEDFTDSTYGVRRWGGMGRGIQRFHSENAFDRINKRTTPLTTATPIPIHQDGQYRGWTGATANPLPIQNDNDYGGWTGGMSSAPISGGRSNTPGFPTCPPTPYLNRPHSPGKPPRSPKSSHRSPTTPIGSEWGSNRSETPLSNPTPIYMVESEIKFARDLSAFWYKPNASREETISALRFQKKGAFLMRNSNSFPGAFGLAIKVDDNATDDDSVRHFLIEPTKYGVRLRGSAIEPVFSSLSALVYSHSIEALALPTPLTLPTSDSVLPLAESESTTSRLLSQGAACQLLFLGLVGVECVSGGDAVGRGVRALFGRQTPTIVSLRLSKYGLTLTDILRQRFFRLHFPLNGISYAALDPEGRTLTHERSSRRIFGVVARSPSALENSCVVLAELEEGQPATAIVAFFQRVIAWQN